MSALENTGWEAFVQHHAKGLAAGRAYEAAGYKAKGASADVNASKLLRNPKVAARLAELQNKAADKTGVTLEWLIEQGKALMLAAQTAEDFSAASSTFERLAKISGNWVDRTDNRNTNTTRLISDAPMGEDEWLTTHSPQLN